MTYQRTLEEALAGVPPRKYFVNKTDKPQVNPKTGNKCAAKAPRKSAPGDGRANGHEKSSWFKIVAAGPSHPDWTPELARKHFEMTAEAQKKARLTRMSTPKGIRALDWKPVFNHRLEKARAIVDKLEYADLIALPEDELEKKSAKEALAFNVAVFKSDELTMKDRLAASKVVLDFTKTRPTTKQEVSVKSAEDFLALLEQPKG